MNIVIKEPINRLQASVSSLASDYKFQGFTRTLAWSNFVKDRDLRPEMNAKDFYKIFDVAVSRELVDERVVDFVATHYDNMLKCTVQIHQKTNGVYDMIWSFGMTGSNPPSIPPDPERYIPIEEHRSGSYNQG